MEDRGGNARRTADRWVVVVIAVALGAHSLLGVSSARRLSVTHDEYWHLPLGLLSWKTGRFDFDALNPPLTRLWSALPLLCTSATVTVPANSSDPADYGGAFLKENRPHYQQFFVLGRCMTVALSVMTGLLLAAWSRKLFGNAACCFTVVLWSTCPTILANAALVTPDMGLAFLFVATTYAVWEYARQSTWRRAALLGVLLGVAQATKFTAVLLYPISLVMWLALRGGVFFWRASGGSGPPSLDGVVSGGANIPVRGPLAGRSLMQWLAVLALSLAVLNAAYLFRGSFSSLGSYAFHSQALRGAQAGLPWLKHAPLPFPRDYLKGLDQQRKVMEQAHPVFLDRQWSIEGFPHYYLMALLYKVPHPLQALLVLTTCFLLFPGREPRLGRLQLFLALPVVVLIGVASRSGMQLGLRYILPSLPFLMLLAGQAGRWVSWKHARLRTVLVVAPLLLTPFSLRYHPHHLAYFNELAGGPIEGREHLLDSNLDWGQALGELKEFLDDRGIDDVGLAYFGTFPPSEMGIRYHLPPSWMPHPGWYAVSVNFVQGRPHTVREPNGTVRSVDLDEYGYFRSFPPVKRIGYAIDVYHLTPGEVRGWYSERRPAR